MVEVVNRKKRKMKILSIITLIIVIILISPFVAFACGIWVSETLSVLNFIYLFATGQGNDIEIDTTRKMIYFIWTIQFVNFFSEKTGNNLNEK